MDDTGSPPPRVAQLPQIRRMRAVDVGRDAGVDAGERAASEAVGRALAGDRDVDPVATGVRRAAHAAARAAVHEVERGCERIGWLCESCMSVTTGRSCCGARPVRLVVAYEPVTD